MSLAHFNRLPADLTEDTNHSDILLLPFLRSCGEASEAYLSELIAEQTESTIKGILRSKLRVSLCSPDGSHNNQEALELLAEVQADLLAGLRELKRESRPRAIGNLHNYVAAVTFNACHQLLRRKYPQRLRLKNKLRYLLTHVPEFALWETADRQWLCGFVSWRTALPTSETSSRHVAGRGRSGAAFIELLTSIFQSLHRPALLEEVVTLVAESMGIKDEIDNSHRTSERRAAKLRANLNSHAGIQTELEQRAELQKVWSAICKLPLRHRAALLLNLRDNRGADTLALLPLTRVATICEIAHVLEFKPEHFASVWNDLPWDDLKIATHLGLSRQQIINLRQSSRARLARELKEF